MASSESNGGDVLAQEATSSETSSRAYEYEFTFPSLRKLVLQLMLQQHTELIKPKVEVALEAQERAKRKRFMEKFEMTLQPQEQPQLTGMLDVRRKDTGYKSLKRRVQGDWKRRYVELNWDSFRMYKVGLCLHTPLSNPLSLSQTVQIMTTASAHKRSIFEALPQL